MLLRYINYKKSYQKIIGNAFNSRPRIFEKFMRTIDLFNKDQYEKAYFALSKIIKKCETKEEYAAVYFFMGLNCERSGYVNAAMELYEKAIDYDDTKPTFWNNLGLLHQQEGEYPKAIEMYEKAITCDREYEVAYHNLGAIYYRLAENEKALEYCFKTLELKPNYFKSAEIICCIYYIENNFEKSKKYFQMAVTSGSSKERVHSILLDFKKFAEYGEDDYFEEE